MKKLTPTTFIHHNTGSPSQNNEARKEKALIGKEEIKLSVFVVNMIIYIENPKDSTTHKKIIRTNQ